MRLGMLMCVAACALSAGSVSSAGAQTYGFANITGNSATNAASGGTQLFVDVLPEASPVFVTFRFRNVGPAPMSITDVYFDDGTLLGIASVTNSSGVNFSQGASPGNLPGGNTLSPAFDTTAGFSADSNPPAQPNGVNPGEELRITFQLLAGRTLADTVAALNAGTDLRIGIHVQGFGDGGSESFVNVPAPSAAMAAMMTGAWATSRRRRRAAV